MRARWLAALVAVAAGAALLPGAGTSGNGDGGGRPPLLQGGQLDLAGPGPEPVLPVLAAAPPPAMLGTDVSAGPAPLAVPAPAPPPAATPPPPPSPWSAVVAARLADPRLAGTTLGLSVWVEGLGEVAAHNPDLPLLPASNQKLFTAMAVMAGLPAGERLLTEVRANGVQQGDTLIGDLVLVGGGDPTLRLHGVHSLDELAAAVRARGITRVTGELWGDESRYDGVRSAVGWRPEHVPIYIGPLSALVVERNQHRGDSDYATNPLPGNLARFRSALARAGVTVAGRDALVPAPPGSTVLVSVGSPTVGELTAHMLGESDNLVAELLLKELGRRGRGRGTTTDGLAVAAGLLAPLGVPLAGASADGSGLSRADLRSAREWRLLLQAAAGQPWGPALSAALPVAGRSGTLARRLRGTAAEGNVRAKTGWIDEARALSGYFTTPAGRPAVFSVLVNGTTPQSPALNALDALVAALVGLRD